MVSAEWSINERERETARCRFCCSADHTPASLLPILSLDHQPPSAAGDFLRLPVVMFLHHCISTVRPGTTPPLGWLRGRGGSMPAVVRGKRLRRFVLLLPRRADFHLLPCDTTESRATQDALPRARVASTVGRLVAEEATSASSAIFQLPHVKYNVKDVHIRSAKGGQEFFAIWRWCYVLPCPNPQLTRLDNDH